MNITVNAYRESKKKSVTFRQSVSSKCARENHCFSCTVSGIYTHECISFRKSKGARMAQSGFMRNRCVMAHSLPDHLWFAHDSTLLNKGS